MMSIMQLFRRTDEILGLDSVDRQRMIARPSLLLFLGNYDEGPIVFIAIYGKASYVIVFILQNEYYAHGEG